MESLKLGRIVKLKESTEVTSILVYSNGARIPALTDAFDLLLLVIVRDGDRTHNLFHYIEEGLRIQERWLGRKALEEWIDHGANRDIMQWILQGEILVDKEAYLEPFRRKLEVFPKEVKERKLLIEFSLFLRCYLQSKDYLQENQLLDAYDNILEALHHWARLAIIEQGIHPEVTLWDQIHRINPGVYKLYEELTTSRETLELRIQLLLLACEFSVLSKLEDCCGILLRIIESREQAWSVDELQNHPDLQDTRINLSLLLDKLVKKSLIREVAVPLADDLSVLELRYAKQA